MRRRWIPLGHWERAIESHQQNHPWADHYHTKVEATEPRTVVDGDNMHSATLEYTDGNESVSVSTSAEATDFDYEESDLFEAVDVGDKTGYLNADGNFTSLYIEDDQSYSVYGDIGEDTAIDVAEALLDQ
jgi:hypothetical protein